MFATLGRWRGWENEAAGNSLRRHDRPGPAGVKHISAASARRKVRSSAFRIHWHHAMINHDELQDGSRCVFCTIQPWSIAKWCLLTRSSSRYMRRSEFIPPRSERRTSGHLLRWKSIQNHAGCRSDGAVTIFNGGVCPSEYQRERNLGQYQAALQHPAVGRVSALASRCSLCLWTASQWDPKTI